LKESVAKAAAKSGRRASEIQTVLVSKTVPVERIREALAAGMRDFGENRVQEFVEKKAQLPEAQWHMIGHLQTNKVKQVIGEVVLIHSLDSLELAEAIERQAEQKNLKSVPCLIQVNSSGETTKFGLNPKDVESFIANLKVLRIQIRGLMTIGPLTEEEAKIRNSFQMMKKLQEKMKKQFPEKEWDILSMGMSGDYAIAIEEGSTLIRVGTAVFGERAR